VQLPRIRSESPAFDLHHPDVAKLEYPASGAPQDNLLDAGEDQGRLEHLQEVEQDRGTTSSDDSP
jgi:cytochrome c oxidase subunit 1